LHNAPLIFTEEELFRKKKYKKKQVICQQWKGSISNPGDILHITIWFEK
jgi:hypothetical protein